MELKTVADVTALTELQKIERIRVIEKKLERIKTAPILGSVAMMLFLVFITWFDLEYSAMEFFIMTMALLLAHYQLHTKQADLLKQLFELKIG